MTETAAERKPLGKMTVAELEEDIRRISNDLGQDVPETAGLKKAELVAVAEALLAAGQARNEASRENEPDPGSPEDAEVATEDTAIVPPEVEDEVGAAIALREQAVDPVSALPSPAEWNAALAIANQIAGTTFVPESYRNRAPDVVAAILFGRELGLGPMTAMRDIHMIDGRPALAAHRQLALLRKGGVVLLESEVVAERAWIRAQRRDTGEIMAVEFTMEEASRIKRKGKFLVDGDNWKNYPTDMLWARAVGRLTRRLGSDLLNGLPPYVAEEVADFSGWGVEYGESGELVAQAGRRELPEYRKEYPDYNWPGSWGELMDRLGGKLGEAEALEWVRQGVEAVYNADSLAVLERTEREQMFRRASGFLATIEDDHPEDFPPVPRADTARAFAKYLDAVVLDGPPWRTDPTEEDRPTRDDWVAAQETTSGTSREPDPEEEASYAGDHEGAAYTGGYE